MTQPVIDMWSPIVPSWEIMAHRAEHFPPDTLSYFSVFSEARLVKDRFRGDGARDVDGRHRPVPIRADNAVRVSA